MAALTDAGPSLGDGYPTQSVIGITSDRAVSQFTTGRPPAEGSLIILSPTGGMRG